MRCAVLLLLLAFEISGAVTIGRVLPQAHAHNDYEHARPLFDALAHGFTSVEADVHLVNGELLVAHDAEDVDGKRTLSALYLEPLHKIARNRRSIYEAGGTLMLLIDIKTEAEPTYAALKRALEKYTGILTVFEGGEIHTNAVTVILSGNRPREMLLGEKKRFVAFDGRISDLGKNLSKGFMPLVSDNWNNHFRWKGEGEFSESERKKLRELVGKAHAEGRWIRLWATPERREVWRELREAGVDFINTDDLPGLAAFLRERR